MELAMSKSPSNIINKKVILLFTCIAFCLSGCEEKYTSPQEDNPEEWTWTDIGGGTDNGLEAVVPEVGAITSGKFENLMIQSKHTTS
jgi:hypothetical protein